MTMIRVDGRKHSDGFHHKGELRGMLFHLIGIDWFARHIIVSPILIPFT